MFYCFLHYDKLLYSQKGGFIMTIYLSENLKRLRREKELTQEKLAEFLGVTVDEIIKEN